jgi:hypothetical protein
MRHRRILALSAEAMLVVAAALGSGCDTFKQDIGGFMENVVPPKPVVAAQWMLDPYDAENRRRGTTLIAHSPGGGAEANVKLYRDRVENETNALVLGISIRALARHGKPEDAVLIAKHLSHPAMQVRWEVAKGLQRLHNPAVVEPIWKKLIDENEDPDVRAELATALGQYPTEDSFQSLVAVLDARELAVNEHAQASLRTMTGQDFGLDRAGWLNWRKSVSEPFTPENTFLYPTYRRKLTWLDHLNFLWPITFENPAPPVGLIPAGTRSTYQEPSAGG